MATNAELTQQLADLTKLRAADEKKIAKLTGELTSERDRANTNAGARQDLEGEIEKLQVELRSASASLKAFRGSATRARNELQVVKKTLSPEKRAIGPLKAPRDAVQEEARRDDLAAAFAADTTELVFSDGKHEIRELAPLTVTGDAWRVTPSRGPADLGRVLNHEPILEPGDMQRQEVTLRGFGLLNETGDQVAYCPLIEPVTIGRNQRVQLPHNSIRF